MSQKRKLTKNLKMNEPKKKDRRNNTTIVIKENLKLNSIYKTYWKNKV